MKSTPEWPAWISLRRFATHLLNRSADLQLLGHAGYFHHPEIYTHVAQGQLKKFCTPRG